MDVPSRKGNMLDVLRIPYLRKRVILMSLIWCVPLSHICFYRLTTNDYFGKSDSPAFSTSGSRTSTSLVYYGLSLNVGSFGMNIYITQLVFGVAEVPGSLLSLTLNQRIGRRLTQSGSLIFAGATSLSILAIPRGTLVALVCGFAFVLLTCLATF